MPAFFPRIFGPGENESLSSEETMRHFRQLTKEINHFLAAQAKNSANGLGQNKSDGAARGGKTEMSVEEVAMGFIRVANEAMCRPIRALTQVMSLSFNWGDSETCSFCVILLTNK